MRKRNLFIVLLLIGNFLIFSENLINKIIYKKVLLDFDQQVLINVYLNKIDIVDVAVYFNNKEIKNINKNLKSLVREDNNFYPSLNFELSGVKKDNNLHLEIFHTPFNASRVDVNISFEKGIVVDGYNLRIGRDKFFFVKAGDFLSEEIFYDIEIDNSSIIEKIDEVVKDNVLFYKFRSIKNGNTKIVIYKYDESLEKQNNLPYKSVRITVGD
jgi:hypothetical protein